MHLQCCELGLGAFYILLTEIFSRRQKTQKGSLSSSFTAKELSLRGFYGIHSLVRKCLLQVLKAKYIYKLTK